MIRAYELVDLVRAYAPAADEDLLDRAYVFAMKKHGSQQRANGAPYFTHPLEVAQLLAGMKLDEGSIITGLLHDTIEDTDATYEEIAELFGEDIARLVDGVTKLSRMELQNPDSKQAENFRKLIVAMSEDIRVLLVKLADRLHNMQTLHYIEQPERRQRIARETLEIYAPLAERMGINQVKEQLEDLAFTELYPEGRQSILNRLDFLRDKDGALVAKISQELGALCAEHGLSAEITGREKRPYSIWRKMERKQVSFEELSDVVAFRIVVDDVADCYAALGYVHGAYPVIFDRFKDYISMPKTNGYRSLHTTVLGPENRRIEIQIRTREMHEEAELGVAAHWAYKQGEPKDGRYYRWLQHVLDILDQDHRPDEFLEHTKLELFRDEVFCFTPRGDLIALPRGATTVDFAYAVHSEVGDRTVGAKVNGRLVPLNTELENGDQVEIMTADNQTPSPTWERFVVTGKARACLRRFIRLKQRDEYRALGKAMLQKRYKQEGQRFSEKQLVAVLEAFKAADMDDLYAGIGFGDFTAQEVLQTAVPDARKKRAADGEILEQADGEDGRKARPGKKQKKGTAVPIRGLIPGMAVHYAGCCHPVPGDRIVGIVTTGKGVTIHTADCEALSHFQATPERWLPVTWDNDRENAQFIARIYTILLNDKGSLGTLSSVIGQYGGNITNLKIVKRSIDFWDMLVDIHVEDERQLSTIIAALRATTEISSVWRDGTGRGGMGRGGRGADDASGGASGSASAGGGALSASERISGPH